MYEKRTLPNGVRIVSEWLDTVRTVSVGIWVKNGSRYESPEVNGISHFIEHMIFKGTEKRSARHIAIALDALGGQSNAFTDKEYTCYYIKVLDSRLQTAVSILADIFLHSAFAPPDIELERGVVLEEIGMYEDSPEDVAIDQLIEGCYAGSALGKPILGTPDTLATFTTDTLHSYMRTHYHPADTVIAVSGHFDEEDLDYIASLFAPMPGSGRNMLTPATYQPYWLFREKDIEQNHLCLSFPGVSVLSSERYAVNLLHSILGGGMSSRLFQAIREQNGLCYSIYTFPTMHLDTGLLSVYVGLNPETEQRALELILQELRTFCAEGPTPDEMSRSREQVRTSLLMGLESTDARMMKLGKSEIVRDTVIPIEQTLTAYEAVTAADLQALAQRTFDETQLSFSVVGQPSAEEHYREIVAKS